MEQRSTILAFRTSGAGLYPITHDVAQWTAEAALASGLLTLFCRHTSASLTIQENASPEVLDDIGAWLDRLAPEGAGYAHADEGPDDMPAHLKAVLTGVSLAIPLVGGRLALGQWQGIFLAEHRRAPHRREVALHFVGA